jgi:hypothetical protein
MGRSASKQNPFPASKLSIGYAGVKKYTPLPGRMHLAGAAGRATRVNDGVTDNDKARST